MQRKVKILCKSVIAEIVIAHSIKILKLIHTKNIIIGNKMNSTFHPYKVGDRVFNKLHTELEVISFDISKVECSDGKVYDAENLHYFIHHANGQIFSYNEFKKLCHDKYITDESGDAYFLYRDGILSNLKIRPSDIVSINFSDSVFWSRFINLLPYIILYEKR